MGKQDCFNQLSQKVRRAQMYMKERNVEINCRDNWTVSYRNQIWQDLSLDNITRRQWTDLESASPPTYIYSRWSTLFRWKTKIFSTIVKQCLALFNTHPYFTDTETYRHFQLTHYAAKWVIRKTPVDIRMEPCIWVLTFWSLRALCPSSPPTAFSPAPSPAPHFAWG